MARNWKEAQGNEKEFWDSVLLHQSDELYIPPTRDFLIDYAKKYLDNFLIDVSTLECKQVIDLGCGPFGIVSGLFYLTKNVKIYGVDPLVDEYKKYGYYPQDNRVILKAVKGEDLCKENLKFDVVFSRNVFDHVEEPHLFAQNCRDICNSDGEVYLSFNIIFNFWTSFKMLMPYIDKNHPHHFTEKSSVNVLKEYFKKVTIIKKKTIKEENPEFSFFNIIKLKNKRRAIKRWLSTFVLLTLYVKCEN
jgi:2-polyprenyl-3-methyl-5-hydroxy-6-metoxy-1,4-benzoquinol methylase